MFGPELQDVSERRERGLRVAAMPREETEPKMSLPQVGLDSERGFERGPRFREAGRVAFDRALPRGLERVLERGVADPEAKAARLTRDLPGRLALEHHIELARGALPVTELVRSTREIEPHDRGTVRRERGFVARDRRGVLTARVQRRAVRSVELPTRRARRDGALEGGASSLEVAALKRDDRDELLRRAVGLARRSDPTQVRERGGARPRVRVELRETHEVRVGQRAHGVRVLERDDRLVHVTCLGAELAKY